MKKSFIILAIITLGSNVFAQTSDTLSKESNTKSGWSFGGVPVIAYDSDRGFKYGGLINLYHYGDGSIYPEYKHSIYLEWSRTTKGSGINQITYDSKYLIPKIRVSGELSYLTENGLDFYGFNGYKSVYNSNFEDDELPDSIYKSRMFYRQDRKLFRARADFSGKIKETNFKWITGLVYYNIKLDTIDIDNLNQGKDEDLLPPVGGGLFGLYKEWGVLPEDQFDGGQTTLLKAGIVYDTRDNEPNPMSGMWSELLLLYSPGFLSDDYNFAKFALTHRQYFTIVQNRLSFAYRLAYQGKLFGEAPSYMLPVVFNYSRFTDYDGLGGLKNVRGILRNRVVGEDFAYGNFELRWKFVNTVVFNQNLYLALSAFTDFGIVTREYKLNLTNADLDYFSDEKEGIHQSVGGGLRVALNENFIVAADYGVALDEDDGDKGLYIGLNWLF